MSKTYKISQAKIEDRENIMQFIDKFWRPNHILAKDKDFFNYEHLNGDNINFFLAKDIKSSEILAIQGFIPYGSDPNSHICGVISRVHPNSKIPLLGVELMKKMLEHTSPKTYCGIGTNPKTMLPLVKRFFKRSTGVMDQFFILNPEISEFKIAYIPDNYKKIIQNQKKATEIIEHKLINERQLNKNFSLIKVSNKLPVKNLNYIIKRYFNHPRYKYNCYLLKKNKNFSLLITRQIICNGRKIIRIIDFIGELEFLGYLRNWAASMLSNSKYEYIDILTAGLDKKILYRSGFYEKKHNQEIVIPTYFEPFVKENIDIHYEKSDDKIVLFKGDADGDRPNTLN